MRKNRAIEQNKCYHLVNRLAHRAFFLDDEEKDRTVALMRRVEAGVQASMSYCINRTEGSGCSINVWSYYGKRMGTYRIFRRKGGKGGSPTRSRIRRRSGIGEPSSW